MIYISDIPEDGIIFYDIETDSKYAPYAKIREIGFRVGFDGEFERANTPANVYKFRKYTQSREVLKVGFNNKNYDDIVLRRHGFKMPEVGNHDGYLMMKAICPNLPAYSLKFINWWFLGDMHLPEMEMEAYCQHNGISGEAKWSQVPDEYLIPYLAHDIKQHENVFRLAWENVQLEKHWNAYLLDLSQGEVVYEMSCLGGLHLDAARNAHQIASLQSKRDDTKELVYTLTGGEVENPNSSKQLGKYFDAEGFALALSDNGDFAVGKQVLLDLKSKNEVADAAYYVRGINAKLKYFKNYAKALEDTTYDGNGESSWIPTAFSISAARTRRYTSSSMYGLNFQNPDKEAKKVQIVPAGWLGFWIDATQIENVVHIYESEDNIRRAAYESNEDWSEYVWLCNRILGTNKTKDELDSIPSPQMPNWSVYKQFKIAKLALNFGMGISKFCSTTGVSLKVGQTTFNDIHDACPAIRSLQEKVRILVTKHGYVQDVFGHCYENTPRMAYKLVAYLIQGCGTGSLPKAQMRANFDTIHSFDERNLVAGRMCVTTHDENGGRLNLQLGSERIFAILQKIMFNMTEKFSDKFDNIPLRAKLYLSRKNAAERIEIKTLTYKQVKEICT